MTRIKLKGFQLFKDRHGRWRCYHRKSRTPIDLTRFPLGSAEFIAECARIVALKEAQTPKEKPGSLGMLICDYRASAAFLDLAPRTQADYQKHFDYLRPIADTPLARLDRPLVVRIRDRAAATKGRRFGNYLKATLSVVFGWGRERGYLADNPASGIKAIRRPKGAPDANRPWSDAERHAVLDAAPAHMLPAIAMMMMTGLGPKDALSLPRSHWRDGEIGTKRAKTGEPVFWPVPAPLDAILRAAPRHDAVTLCASSTGRPWTLDGFRASWRTLRMRLEADGAIGPGLTLYGLRHTVAVILREAGCDERTIADALGQKTIEMARRYARGADLRPKMRGVVASFDAELNKRRTKLVKLD
ncbi:tyrosine-type recombinase/integrase [Methylocystis parvus]|uniref:tyrosine-type recombinase/integrase n=1 Tax=Methylocystis parvus TaxID=134 RepID=UPI003C77A144